MSGIEFFGIKLATLFAAAVGALLSVGIDIKSHTYLTACGAVFSGVFIAYVATVPTIEFLGLSENWESVVPAIYGIVGRNLIVWISRVSKNPEGIISAVLKLGKK